MKDYHNKKYYEEGIKICNSERSTYKWNISKDKRLISNQTRRKLKKLGIKPIPNARKKFPFCFHLMSDSFSIKTNWCTEEEIPMI
ncbi:hypothetical protein H8356DRAFT_1415792 [Neocallimastix lanati (nom. inval.)]|nr:hypothetical protein H8356DRAFT_1415792 [Neocallimastix sp. JGI-2020a]